MARRYASEGANVVLGDIDTVSAEQVVNEVARGGGHAIAVHLDGSGEQSVDAAVRVCLQRYGGLDGLHANFASLADNSREHGILELPLEIFDQTQRVNARGYYLCTRAALPALLARGGGGAIAYTSSIAACTGGEAQVAMQ